MVPLSFVSVTVPGGCRSQGCHGYPTRSAPVLEAPPSFQAPSPSSSIVDEFNCSFLSTDDSLDYQSPSEAKRRIFPSTDKASQQMEGTTVDPEGIPDDLLIISFLNFVADQVLDLFIKIGHLQ